MKFANLARWFREYVDPMRLWPFSVGAAFATLLLHFDPVTRPWAAIVGLTFGVACFGVHRICLIYDMVVRLWSLAYRNRIHQLTAGNPFVRASSRALRRRAMLRRRVIVVVR